jgi:hypothetical protein
MTDYKATPEQWRQIENSQVFNATFQTCVLELRSRVEKLELGAGIRDLVAEGVKDTFKPTSNLRQIRSSLSSPAQAILDAYQFAPIDDHLTAAAAVLRSVADQVVPEQALEDVPGRFVNGCCHARLQDTRAELLAIADELEQLDA